MFIKLRVEEFLFLGNFSVELKGFFVAFIDFSVDFSGLCMSLREI